jgi:flagellar biogenesis protein FliO
MDPEGRSLTQAGKICGMISTILALIGLIGACVWMIFVFGIMAAAGGAASP